MSDKQDLSVPTGTVVNWFPSGDGKPIPMVVIESYKNGACVLESIVRRQTSPPVAIRHRSDPLFAVNPEVLRVEGCWDWVPAPAWGPHAPKPQFVPEVSPVICVERPGLSDSGYELPEGVQDTLAHERVILKAWNEKGPGAAWVAVRTKGVKKAEFDAVLAKHGLLDAVSE